jgi:hypothetical protein
MSLTASLAIPLKAAGYSHIEGATEITYGSSGSPQYYTDVYKIFQENSSDTATTPFIEVPVSTLDWNVVHNIDFYKIGKDGEKVIDPNTGEYAVSAMAQDYVPKLSYLYRYDASGYLAQY